MKIGETAVLAIDFQNESRAGETYPVENYERILGNAALVINAARRAKVPVIHVQAWIEAHERGNYALLNETLTEDLRYAAAGSEGADICHEVAPEPGETVIRKRWPSAFQGTELAGMLERLGARHMLVTGIWTDSCVRASVFDAVYAGYHVWLVKDACGSATDTMHRVGMLDMANRLYGGGVLDASEACKALAGETFKSWKCARPIGLPYTLATIDRLYDSL
ncbi:MAG: cysteine hydrolase [Rhizobiaceae bacterium]|nr:cysteine hydrolase [Rhizobiaceae bacterium]